MGTPAKISQILAFPKSLRFFGAQSAWAGYELGLYQSVLAQKIYLPSWQMSVVRLLAKSRVGALSNAHQQIDVLLTGATDKKNIRYALQELSKVCPHLVMAFLEKNPHLLEKNSFFVGLYLVLCHVCVHPPIKDVPDLLSVVDDVEQNFLKNNLLADRDDEKLTLLNQVLARENLCPIELICPDKPFFLDNFMGDDSAKARQQSSAQVTVLVTTYNAQDTIAFCLNSLLKQTWQNLQLIVVDDASDDNTRQIIQNFVKQDSRVLGIVLPKNVGTFVAKSIGAIYATGEFLTCQDSDDWAHPQKIERQVLPLINNPKLIASTSHWLRIDEQGNYYARHYYPFLRHNPASPLFRRERVIKEMGLWHLVRTGADSEFFERLKLVYGEKSIHTIKKPLTLASHRPNSLMTSDEYGAYAQKSRMDRLNYWESWRLWHIDTLSKKQKLIMPSIKEQLDNFIFAVPDKLIVNADDIRHNLKNLTLIKSET